MPRRLVCISALLFVLHLPFPAQGSELKPASRMAILRGLVAESGLLLSPLPRGQK